MKITPKTRIAVLRGGWSGEHSVSMISGQGVLETLQAAGYTAIDIIVEKNAALLLQKITTAKPDVIFNALHGLGGEDGTIQGFLDILQIPYTHSGVLASALAMHKPLAKQIVAAAGVYCPEGITANGAAITDSAPLPYPFVAKPVADGSSLGVYLIFTEADYQKITPILQQDAKKEWLFESYIAGIELTVPVLGNTVLPVIEIAPQGEDWYDFDSKYTAAKHADFIIPARLPKNIEQEIQHAALQAHQALGCRGVSRSDFRYNPDAPQGKQVAFLELNTQPGMTPLSLVPASAAAIGLSYFDVVYRILEEAQ